MSHNRTIIDSDSDEVFLRRVRGRRIEQNWADPNYIEQREILKRCLAQRANRLKEKDEKESANESPNESSKDTKLAEAKVTKQVERVDLPYDILDGIFSYLSGAECQRTVMFVCVDWRNRYDMDEFWKQRVQGEFRNYKAESLPRVYGYKQRYVLIWCYFNNKCSFCFKFFDDNIDFFDDHQPIAEIKVAACAECKREQLLCKTHLKKMYCSTDKEINQLTGYNLKNESRKVYFYTEFLALCDEQFNENMDSELKNRRDKRDKTAQNYLKRIMTTDKAQREILVERLVKEVGYTEEKAKRIAAKVNDVKNQLEMTVSNYKLRKAACEYFAELTGREPTKYEKSKIKCMKDYSSVNMIDKLRIANFVDETFKREEIMRIANEVLKEKTQNKYTHFEDLPRGIRQQYQRQFSTNELPLKTIFEKFFTPELLARLERETNVATLLDASGFNAPVVDYSQACTQYVAYPHSEYNHSEAVKETIEISSVKSDLMLNFQRLDRNSRESLVVDLLNSFVYKQSFGGEGMRKKLISDLGAAILDSGYKKLIQKKLINEFLQTVPSIPMDDKKNKSSSKKKKKEEFLVSSDDEEEEVKPKKRETKKRGRKKKEAQEEEEEEISQEPSASADSQTQKRKSARSSKKKKMDEEDLDLVLD